MRVWRGEASGGEFKEYTVPMEEGMVVLGKRPGRALELQGR